MSFWTKEKRGKWGLRFLKMKMGNLQIVEHEWNAYGRQMLASGGH